MTKTLRFVCNDFYSPQPKWTKIQKNHQGSGYNCTAEFDSVPLEIQELIENNRSAEALRKAGFINPRNFLIEEVIS